MITLDVTITVDAELLYAWIVAWRHANPAHRDWGDEAIIKQALPDAVCFGLGFMLGHADWETPVERRQL
jgi:hypothetical protein